MNAPHTARLPSTVDQIAATLREQIISGELAPGAALRQDRVAQQFGSSHVPVREAFQRLEGQGLVVTLPRRGVRVAALDMASIRENVEMRGALEALALRHAAPHLTDAHIEQLEAAQALCDAADSLAAWDAANRAFHGALVAPCGMPRLLAMIDTLQLANSRVVFAAGRTRGWQPRSNHDHRLIIDALRARDVERSLTLLGRHIGTMERVGYPTLLPVS
jgi:DNA-binding GntR family transcriptional regulator